MFYLKANQFFRIRNLVKTFKNEAKESYNAIDNLNMIIYSGQITAILGIKSLYSKINGLLYS